MVATFSAKLLIHSWGSNQLVLPDCIYLVSKSDFLAIKGFLCKTSGNLVSIWWLLHHGSANFSPKVVSFK